MSIKKRLWLILSLPAVIVLVLLSLFYYSHISLLKLKRDVILYSAINDNVRELTLLNNNLILHLGEKRTLRLWSKKLDTINRKVQNLDITEEDMKQQSESIAQEDKKLRILSAKLIETYHNPQRYHAGSREHYRQRLMGQIQIHLYTVAANVSQLMDHQRLKRLEQEERRNVLIFGSMIGLTLMLAGMMGYFIIGILHPLKQLHAGVSRISGGDFDHEIGLKSNDELGEFSRTLETMTGKFLNAIQQLKDEVELRKEKEVSLAEMNQHLRGLDRLKTLFLQSMSHELRTPLNAIIGFSTVLKTEMAGSLNEKQKEQMERIHKAGKHLLEMVEEALDISDIESGQRSLLVKSFSLTEMLDELRDRIQQSAQKKGIQIRLDIDEEIQIVTDRHCLMRVIDNYLSNAIKYSEKGTVAVTVKQIGDSFQIEVSDEGIGIAEGDIGKLFQPFVRLESPLKVLAGGTGLGLYLIRKITEELLQGSVWVESTVGKGSTFGLTIPKTINIKISDTA